MGFRVRQLVSIPNFTILKDSELQFPQLKNEDCNWCLPGIKYMAFLSSSLGFPLTQGKDREKPELCF